MYGIMGGGNGRIIFESPLDDENDHSQLATARRSER